MMARKYTREEIGERMHPTVSKMEIAMQVRLTDQRIPYDSDKKFVIGITRNKKPRITKPDIFLIERGKALYLDGPAHQGREARDEEIRALLEELYPVKAVSIPYKSYSKAERDRVWKLIEAELV